MSEETPESQGFGMSDLFGGGGLPQGFSGSSSAFSGAPISAPFSAAPVNIGTTAQGLTLSSIINPATAVIALGLVLIVRRFL